MTLTGIIEITGVILEQRMRRHTDIQTDEYAGIIELTGVILNSARGNTQTYRQMSMLVLLLNKINPFHWVA